MKNEKFKEKKEKEKEKEEACQTSRCLLEQKVIIALSGYWSPQRIQGGKFSHLTLEVMHFGDYYTTTLVKRYQ